MSDIEMIRIFLKAIREKPPELRNNKEYWELVSFYNLLLEKEAS